MKQYNWRIVGVFLAVICLFCSCCKVNYLPESGKWYCNELQIQLSFDNDGDSYVIVNSQKIKCGCGADIGSNLLMVGCQELNSKYFYLGEVVFEGRIVKTTKNELIVFDPISEQEYYFFRIS